MSRHTKAVAMLLISSWIIFYLFYFGNINIRPYAPETQTLKHRSLEEGSYKGNEDYLINTAGCYIPNYIKTLSFIEAAKQKVTCGERAIFIDKTDSENSIRFRINDTLLRRQNHNQKYECCYQYVKRSTVAGQEDNHVTYSKCKKFEADTITELKEEIIKVSCTTNTRIPSTSKAKKLKFYEDAYIILKKLRKKESENGTHWNVLVLGIDTFSRARILNSMPKTVIFLNLQGWLDYRGYQKVGYNTFPNLMAFLTGRNMSTVYTKCASTMTNCNEVIIWKKFQNSGYTTAYGEDFLRLPDTFEPHNGFKIQPTNHYMRPLFLTGERERGNLVCTQKLPSAIHTLKYASQFVDAYKNDKFFGMFWLNSYSHNRNNLPSLLDQDILDLFTKLNTTTLKNTFIFFLSDHGVRFGKMRLPVESYYEERLPMFFMWVPLDFRKYHNQAYNNLQLNQNRLTTPYDLHETFQSILGKSSRNFISEIPEACPECTSLFEEKSQDRTCEDARVNEKWCSCHNLTGTDKSEPGTARAIQLAVSHIQNVTKSVKTKRCTKCYAFTLKKVLRTHSHVDYSRNRTNYIIAFEMSPGDIAYEASVQENENGFRIIQPTQTISQYNTKGNCVVQPYDRAFCVCEILKHCK